MSLTLVHYVFQITLKQLSLPDMEVCTDKACPSDLSMDKHLMNQQDIFTGCAGSCFQRLPSGNGCCSRHSNSFPCFSRHSRPNSWTLDKCPGRCTNLRI